jgi:hypothetical protein
MIEHSGELDARFVSQSVERTRMTRTSHSFGLTLFATRTDIKLELLRPYPEEIERRIAVELEAEILRRAASAQDGGA